MKIKKRTVIAFVTGGVVASLVWLGCLWWYQFRISTAVLLGMEREARTGQRILQYLDDPSPSNTTTLAYLATNLISYFPDAVHHFADDYPYLPIRYYWEFHAIVFENYFNERSEKVITEQDIGQVSSEAAVSDEPSM